MATMDYDIAHKNASKLAITVPSTVTRNVLRCDEAGDQYAQAIYKTGGAYDKLAKSFTNIANYCKTALNDSAIAVDKVKSELKDAQKKATSQASGCKARKNEIKEKYNLTADIYLSMNSGS